MALLNTGAWLALRKKFTPKTFTLDVLQDVEFEAIALTEDLEAIVRSAETYSEMMLLAADYGLSSDGVRAHDDPELLPLVRELWDAEEFQADCEPSVKHQVGEKVCDISGMSEFIAVIKQVEEEAELAVLEREEAAKLEAEALEQELAGTTIINGDDELPDVDLGTLHADRASYVA